MFQYFYMWLLIRVIKGQEICHGIFWIRQFIDFDIEFFCETHISLVTSSLFETFQHFLVNLTYWIDCMNNFFHILKWKEIQKSYVWVCYLLFVFLSAFSSILSRTRIIYIHIFSLFPDLFMVHSHVSLLKWKPKKHNHYEVRFLSDNLHNRWS